jgi:ribosome recycling factor
VQVWDKGLAKAVESAIREANLGLNPQAEGQVIRVPLPPLTTERRNELAKAAARYAEHTRVSVRGVRRDGMEQIKAAGKKSELGEDEVKRAEEEVQKLTDQFVKLIDAALVDKDKDIRTV